MTSDAERLFQFEAIRDSSGDLRSSATIVTYDRYTVNTIPGFMDIDTGVFTAPFDGTYEFYLEGETVDDIADLFITWNLNGVPVEEIQVDEGSQHNTPFTNSLTMLLKANDKLLVYLVQGGISCSPGLYHFHFGGKWLF